MNKQGIREHSIVNAVEHHELSRIANLLFELTNNRIITPTQKAEIIRYIEKKLDYEPLLGSEKHNPQNQKK